MWLRVFNALNSSELDIGKIQLGVTLSLGVLTEVAVVADEVPDAAWELEALTPVSPIARFLALVHFFC